MLKVYIIADDMTGANISCSLFANSGIPSVSILDTNDSDYFKNYPVVAVHTDSRDANPGDAYQYVFDAVKMLNVGKSVFFNKRIDSTLRGNIGKEIDGVLDALNNNAPAFVVASFPDSHKTVVNGRLFVNGVPLDETDAANDPTTPVESSDVKSIIESQSKYKVGTICGDMGSMGEEIIVKSVKKYLNDGIRIISFDSATNDDIAIISNAISSLECDYITVDPGPFTQTLVENRLSRKTYADSNILLLIGTVSNIAVAQIEKLKQQYSPYIIKIDVLDLFDSIKHERQIDKIIEEIKDNISTNRIFLLASRIDYDDKIDLSETAKNTGLKIENISRKITKSIAEIGQKIATNQELKNSFDAFYTSGGDVTRAFLQDVHAKGIEVLGDVIPLTVYGKIIGGDLQNKHIVTKGGLVGDEVTLIKCVDYLTNRLDK